MLLCCLFCMVTFRKAKFQMNIQSTSVRWLHRMRTLFSGATLAPANTNLVPFTCTMDHQSFSCGAGGFLSQHSRHSKHCCGPIEVQQRLHLACGQYHRKELGQWQFQMRTRTDDVSKFMTLKHKQQWLLGCLKLLVCLAIGLLPTTPLDLGRMPKQQKCGFTRIRLLQPIVPAGYWNAFLRATSARMMCRRAL